MRDAYRNLQNQGRGLEAVDDQNLRNLYHVLSFQNSHAWLRRLELEGPSEQMQRIRARIVPGVTVSDTLTQLEQLYDRIQDDLGRRWFLFLPPDTVDTFKSPLRGWGKQVKSAFPSASIEIYESSRCLSVGRYTASVFHAMRVLELGLLSLGHKLKLPKTVLDVKTWGTIIEKIEKKIDERLAKMPNSAAKKREAEFYHGLASQFTHFREAWRDRVSHGLRTYEQGEAEAVMFSVRAFMSRLVNHSFTERPRRKP
jgi:hypothetical protein